MESGISTLEREEWTVLEELESLLVTFLPGPALLSEILNLCEEADSGPAVPLHGCVWQEARAFGSAFLLLRSVSLNLWEEFCMWKGS